MRTRERRGTWLRPFPRTPDSCVSLAIQSRAITASAAAMSPANPVPSAAGSGGCTGTARAFGRHVYLLGCPSCWVLTTARRPVPAGLSLCGGFSPWKSFPACDGEAWQSALPRVFYAGVVFLRSEAGSALEQTRTHWLRPSRKRRPWRAERWWASSTSWTPGCSRMSPCA